jgi:hypothetical protein
LCTKVSADVYEAHPETTVVSSVITEVSPAGSKAKPSMILAIDLLKLISKFFRTNYDKYCEENMLSKLCTLF